MEESAKSTVSNREVLRQDPGPVDALRAKYPKRLPTVLTKDETLRLAGCLSGTHQLMAKLIYGSGVRLMVIATLS